MRTALFFAAGSLRMPYRYMLVYDGAAALVELPLLVYAVRYVGGRWQEILALIQRFQTFVVPALLVLLAVGVWLFIRRGSSDS
jgi:membrane protein DedA with SNARE-associated domain